ncbi:MAG TPA: YciI family protein [Haliangiales bacterium]|nr:YciI family protein [Haliangiales bacterium]
MKYMLIIYDNEKVWNDMPEAQKGQLFGEYMSFTDGIKKSGHYVSGAPLQPVSTATSVRVREGKTLKTDGPFAETREQLGGYYMIEAKDLDEACKIAARIPSSRIGTIEVRPVMEIPGA